MSYFVYILQSLKDNRYYIGSTSDVDARLSFHNAGLQRSTRNRIIGKVDEAASKYLWTIDKRGINIALEQIPASTSRGIITHTNISSSAYAGGEVWFTRESSIFINPKSGRFEGASMTIEQWNAAIEAWRKIGYRVEAGEFKPPLKQ